MPQGTVVVCPGQSRNRIAVRRTVRGTENKMSYSFGNFKIGGAPAPDSAYDQASRLAAGHKHVQGKKPTYSKVFRWQPAADVAKPATVELVGSFTEWKKLPLQHEAATNTWQLSVPNILSNRTHHYMLLADGQPVSDKNSDGMAIPEGPQEAQYALTTPRGPRVHMLFAQTK